MSDYLKNLREQAENGIELAGNDFCAEINIDARNVIMILDKLKAKQEVIDKLVEAINKHNEIYGSTYYEIILNSIGEDE